MGSIRTELTINSGLSRSDTGSGLTSLRYLQLENIPDMSDVHSLTGSVRSRSSRTSGTPLSTSDDVFYSAASQSGHATSTPPSSYYSSSSFTRGLMTSLETSSTFRAGSGLASDQTIAQITSTSSTEIIPSTLSLRGTASASHLGDSHDGSTTPGCSTSPSTLSTLTRFGGIRRCSAYSSSRSYSSGYLTEESSDKENSDSYTYSDTRSSSYGHVFFRCRCLLHIPI